MEAPATKFLVLTVSEEEDGLLQAFKDGAQGYLLKNALPEQLFNAIRDIMQGKIAISPSFAVKLLRGLLFRSGGEEEILELVGTGASYKEIGSQLSLSAGTVGHHVQSILGKLRLKNRAQAAMFVRNQGLQHTNRIS